MWCAQLRPGCDPPATPASPWPIWSSIISAQLRPGCDPRRHATPDSVSIDRNDHAQLRPGCDPRRHPAVRTAGASGAERSTKAGVRPPATRDMFSPCPISLLHRSTKAGVRPPATPRSTSATHRTSTTAQLRPGCDPRRHLGRAGNCFTCQGRSTKAGVRPPATPEGADYATHDQDAQLRPGCDPRRHRSARRYSPRCPNDAQLRPGCDPRRHLVEEARILYCCVRSTKAGVRPPATQDAAQVVAVRTERSTKAGVRPPATRVGRSGELVSLKRRSTKAGVRPPATLLILSGSRSRIGLHRFVEVRSPAATQSEPRADHDPASPPLRHRITGGSQPASKYPRLTEFPCLASPEVELGVRDFAGEAIDDH